MDNNSYSLLLSLKFDVVILLTDHSEFDYDMIKNNSKILVDTRGKFRGDQSIIRA